MAKAKTTEKDFAFPLIPAMEHSMLVDERGKDQGNEPGKEGNIIN